MSILATDAHLAASSLIDNHATATSTGDAPRVEPPRVLDKEQMEELLKEYYPDQVQTYQPYFVNTQQIPDHLTITREVYAFGSRVWLDQEMKEADVQEELEMGTLEVAQIAYILQVVFNINNPQRWQMSFLTGNQFASFDLYYDVVQQGYLYDDEKSERIRVITQSPSASMHIFAANGFANGNVTSIQNLLTTFCRARTYIRKIDRGYRLISGIDFHRMYTMMVGFLGFLHDNTKESLDEHFECGYFCWIWKAEFNELRPSSNSSPTQWKDCFGPTLMPDAQFQLERHAGSADDPRTWEKIFEDTSEKSRLRDGIIPFVAMKGGRSREDVFISHPDDHFFEECVPGVIATHERVDVDDDGSPEPMDWKTVSIEEIVKPLIDESGKYLIGFYLYRVGVVYRAYVSYLDFRFRVRTMEDVQIIMRRLSFMLIVSVDRKECLNTYRQFFSPYPFGEEWRCIFMNREIFASAKEMLASAKVPYREGGPEDYDAIFPPGSVRNSEAESGFVQDDQFDQLWNRLLDLA